MNLHLPADALVLGAAALLAAGVLGAGFADRLRVPGLLLFLVLGMVISSDGLGWVAVDDPELAQIGGTIALILILFEGGLTTRLDDFRRAAAPGLLLATFAVVVTAAVVAAGAMVLLDVDLTTAMLLGAVVSSTDAAAVFTVLRKAPLPRRLTALLEVESGSNDPIAIMLTIGVLEAWQGSPSVLDWVSFGLAQLAGGLVIGLVIGRAAAWLLNRAHLGAVGLYPVLALAAAGLAYGTGAAVNASGFLAVYVTGLLIGGMVPRHRRNIRTFHDGLANTAEIGLFLLLGMLVVPSDLPVVALPALGITLVLVLVARPVAVMVCLVWFRYRPAELALTSWAGLRGAVPIVLATFPFTLGYPNGELIFNVVFFVVLISAAVQGVSVGWVAQRLGLRDDARPWAPVAEALPLDGVDAELIEVDITADLYVAGKSVRQVPLPAGSLLTSLVRDNRVLVPTGSTRLEPGDLVLVAMPRQKDAVAAVTAWARGPTGEAEPH